MTRPLLLLLLAALAPGTGQAPPNDLFVINSNNGNIVRVLPSGELTNFAHIDEAIGLGAVGFAVDAQGCMYVSVPDRASGGAGYLIYKVDTAGKITILARGFPQLAMLVFDNKGTLYAGAGGIIYKIAPSGAVSTLPTGIAGPSCMAFDASGTLFVADVTSGTIHKVNPDTGASTPFVTGLDHPEGLAFDASGNLFVAEIYLNKILKISPSGVVTPVASLPIPRSLAFDPDGDLFITCEGSNAVFMIDKAGAVSQVVSKLSKPLNLAFDYIVSKPAPVVPTKPIVSAAPAPPAPPAPPAKDYTIWVLALIIPVAILIIAATIKLLARETNESK